jgi:rhodanese-related sulfurtransferase
MRIPMMEIPSRIREIDKECPVAVICHSGGRSGRVADFLSQQGFSKVANIVGGIDAWTQEVDNTIARY